MLRRKIANWLDPLPRYFDKDGVQSSLLDCLEGLFAERDQLVVERHKLFMENLELRKQLTESKGEKP